MTAFALTVFLHKQVIVPSREKRSELLYLLRTVVLLTTFVQDYLVLQVFSTLGPHAL